MPSSASGPATPPRRNRRLTGPRTAARAIRLTDSPQTPWHVVDAADDNHRRAALLTILRDSLRSHAKDIRPRDKAAKKAIKHEKKSDKKPPTPKRGPLARVDLSKKLSKEAYAKAFHARQARL